MSQMTLPFCKLVFFTTFRYPAASRRLYIVVGLFLIVMIEKSPKVCIFSVAHGTLFEHCTEVETRAQERLEVMMEQIALIAEKV